MKAARRLAGAVATAAVLASAALASGADRPQAAPVDVFVEPSGHPLPDGVFLGYVRGAALPDATVSVDFVSLEWDVVGNERGEELAYAGGLGLLDLVGPEAHPFRVTIRDDAIVGLQSADDLLAP